MLKPDKAWEVNRKTDCQTERHTGRAGVPYYSFFMSLNPKKPPFFSGAAEREGLLWGQAVCNTLRAHRMCFGSLVRQSGRMLLGLSRRSSARCFRLHWKEGNKVMYLLPGDSQKEPWVHFFKRGGWKHSSKVKQILASLPASLALLIAGEECRSQWGSL